MKDEYRFFFLTENLNGAEVLSPLQAVYIYHPLLKRQIPLSVMEADQESSENIWLFWSLLTGDDKTVFNPQGWCRCWCKCSEVAGANKNGLQQVLVRMP